MHMKQNWKRIWMSLALAAVLLVPAGCGSTQEKAPETEQPPVESHEEKKDQVANASEMSTVDDVVEADMKPITADQIKDGTYAVTVDSSSKMFKIVDCQLTVADGKMTAAMTMSGTGYTKIFMGTGEEAAAADEADCIPFAENAQGEHTYTVEVEALDAGISCAAFSKNKEKWYDRTLVFRADSLPLEAFEDGLVTLPESLELEDGDYMVNVTLKGGSGKAKVVSPAALKVENGSCTATIVWSSSNYDYMKIGETVCEPLTLEPTSTFALPVAGFDWPLAVIADTTAMSEPHEIAYTLTFDAASIQPAG